MGYSIITEYVCVDARFYFFDGKNRYTVEYAFGLNKWFVFNDRLQTDAIYIKEDFRSKLNNINIESAEQILMQYLDSNINNK